MNNFLLTANEYIMKFAMILGEGTKSTGWEKFESVMKTLLPTLWIASALISTFWLIFRIIKTTHKGGEADDQGEYEKHKAARKRALIAWIFGLCWPVILMLVWPLIPVLGKAFGWEEAMDIWPKLF